MRVPCACAFCISVPARGESNFNHLSWLFTAREGVCELDTPLPGACWVHLLSLCEEDGWSLLLLCWCRSNAWSGASAEMEGGPAYVQSVLPFEKSSYVSAKEEVTASSILQFECVSWKLNSLADLHSDSHTPYEAFLNKFLWPMCWSFGIWPEWGSGFRTFKVIAPLENLGLSWVRRVVGDDCVEILRVVF